MRPSAADGLEREDVMEDLRNGLSSTEELGYRDIPPFKGRVNQFQQGSWRFVSISSEI